MLKYKDFVGTVEYSADDKVFYGRLAMIDDLVTFEADNVADLEKNFKNSVDDYLETCKNLGKDPHKTFKGVFNVRISGDLHKKAYRTALQRNISLNKFVENSIRRELDVLTN